MRRDDLNCKGSLPHRIGEGIKGAAKLATLV